MADATATDRPEERVPHRLPKRPRRRWIVLLVLLIAIACDVSRQPADQLTGRIYVALVRGYQYALSPRLQRFVQCRYEPSCSEYSIRAVRRHGMLKGGWQSVGRICRCRANVPPGTEDPVPAGR